MTAQWIWYPGEFETRLINDFNARRYERDVFIPPLWRACGICPAVKFARKFTLAEPDRLEIRCDGRFNVERDVSGEREEKRAVKKLPRTDRQGRFGEGAHGSKEQRDDKETDENSFQCRLSFSFVPARQERAVR